MSVDSTCSVENEHIERASTRRGKTSAASVCVSIMIRLQVFNLTSDTKVLASFVKGQANQEESALG